MTEDLFPTVRIAAVGENRFEVTLPAGEGTQVPTLPEELRGEEIPSFVLEWIAESDEIGLIIQELLQAPTRSLCRIFRVPTQDHAQLSTPMFNLAPTAFPTGLQTSPEVSGFDQPDAAPDTIPGLPEGVQLPARLLELVAMTKRLEAWIEKGWRVRAWAEEHGYGDAPWLPAAL